MLNLKIIIASTRPGRKAPSIAAWFTEIAKKHADFSVEVLDLLEINLPFLDEVNHPVLQKYEKQHTKDWSATINGGDVFVIITSEYNYSFPASLKNAIDFLSKEWNYKAVGFVSYGGISGGTRAVEALRQVMTAVGMMSLPQGVAIPAFTKHIDENGKFMNDPGLDKSADGMLNELYKWGVALKGLRG